MQKILVIGANGLLGTKLISLLSNEKYSRSFNLIAADVQRDLNLIPESVNYKYIDITDKENIDKTFFKIRPNIVILTAAYTDVDGSEDNRETAYEINAVGPGNVALACRRRASKLIHISTDFVFDGEKGDYSEEDNPNPLSYYAITKLEGEKRVIESGADFLICRTAVLYGWYSNRLNFITWILENLKKGKEITITTDQINSPTYANNLAEILLHLTEYRESKIIHTVGDCALNRYEMALKCAEIFNYSKDLIHPTDSFKQKAIRPKKSSLNVSKLKNILGNKIKVCTLEDGLNFMKNHPEL